MRFRLCLITASSGIVFSTTNHLHLLEQNGRFSISPLFFLWCHRGTSNALWSDIKMEENHCTKCSPSAKSILKLRRFQCKSSIFSVEAVIVVTEVALRSALPSTWSSFLGDSYIFVKTRQAWTRHSGLELPSLFMISLLLPVKFGFLHPTPHPPNSVLMEDGNQEYAFLASPPRWSLSIAKHENHLLTLARADQYWT